MPKIFIFSDTHFNHNFMVDSWIRPKNYNELIKKNWIKYINKEDTVIHLWDVIFARASELWDILNNLPWYKILVKWNHDRQPNNWYLTKWFNFVCDKIELEVSDKKLYLSHKPLDLKEWEYNIHWHLHENTHRDDEFNLTDRHFLYSCELNKYKPKLLSEYKIWDQ